MPNWFYCPMPGFHQAKIKLRFFQRCCLKRNAFKVLISDVKNQHLAELWIIKAPDIVHISNKRLFSIPDFKIFKTFLCWFSLLPTNSIRFKHRVKREFPYYLNQYKSTLGCPNDALEVSISWRFNWHFPMQFEDFL